MVVLGVAAGLAMGSAGHPLIAHLMGASAVEVLLRGGLGFCLCGIHSRHGAAIGLGVGTKRRAGDDAQDASQGGGKALETCFWRECGDMNQCSD